VRQSYSSSHLSLFAPRLFTWQQQRDILSSPTKTRVQREDSASGRFVHEGEQRQRLRDEHEILGSARTHVTPTNSRSCDVSTSSRRKDLRAKRTEDAFGIPRLAENHSQNDHRFSHCRIFTRKYY